MGWYTDRSKAWELQNMWGIFLSIILSPLFFIGIHGIIISCMAVIVKKKSWLLIGIISFATNILLWRSMFKNFSDLNFASGAFSFLFWLLVPIICIFYTVFITKKFIILRDYGLKYGLVWYKKRIKKIEKTISEYDFFIDNLTYWKKQIDEKSIKRDVEKMIHFVQCMNENRDVKNTIFISRHKDTVEKTLQQYKELENSQLDNETIQASKKRLVRVINIAKNAFEQELTNQLKSKIFDVDAETDAYLQNLKNKDLVK